jgi:GNAT superfamily N-acetyltransferase
MAVEEIVGFALCSDRGDDLYLDQLSVLPRHGRRGLGSRLVRRCLQEAEARAFKRVSLSTFRKVPWNGPFYRKLGFREVPGWRLNDWQEEIRELQKHHHGRPPPLLHAAQGQARALAFR